jgi:hypothetical protein
MKRALVLACALSACHAPRPPASYASDALAQTLARLEGHTSAVHTRALLDETLAADGSRCAPPAEAVLSPPSLAAERRIAGELLHYGFFPGPMRYRVDSHDGLWRVRLNIAVEPPPAGQTLELSDCALGAELEGPVHCLGIPYEQAPGLEACPGSGRFEAPATRRNLRALLARWSREPEEHFNRDARRYGVPVRYDFELFLADEPGAVGPIDVRLPLWTSCGRTPYFLALRSGWSVSIVAHELGHYLGLIDEYQPLSGTFYEKTPYPGSEQSRMGVSMKPVTRFWPLHHYLVLRRYHCAAG